MRVVPGVVQQHVDEAINVFTCRALLARAPHAMLGRLGAFDERLDAHLEGISLAGEHGWKICEAALERPSPGLLFTMSVRALEDRRSEILLRLIALAQNLNDSTSGLVAAFGWVEPEKLSGVVRALLRSGEPFRRGLGIASCAMHRLDPGLTPNDWGHAASPHERARALRTAGEIGRQDFVSSCAVFATADENPDCQFWAAWSAVLLGDRNRGLEVLTRTGMAAASHRPRALRLGLQAMSIGEAHGVLQDIARDPQQARWLIEGSGIAGDPAYVPWLVGHMAKPDVARLAGEAFSLITGADLDTLQLSGERPKGFEAGPSDDPEDPNVDIDPDDGLPWPDPERIEKWWAANSGRFQAGTRYFMGAPVTREHCIDVLKNGYQRQRILAAHYLCLLNPGTPLFNTSAPAWRQQKLLAQME